MRWQFRIHAGETRRWHRFMETPLPAPIAEPLLQTGALPTLFQVGRQRPIACQIINSAYTADTPEPPQLVWTLQSLARNRTQDFILTSGDRQRRAPARVRIRSTAAGWSVVMRKETNAEILSPEKGVRHLLLLGQLPHPVRVAFGPIGTARRVRVGKPAIRSGPALGQFAADYLYLDGSGRPQWSEELLLSFPDSPAEYRVVDCRIVWHANFGPITLASDINPTSPGAGGEAAAIVPSLSVESDSSLLAEARGAPGLQLRAGESPFPAPFVVAGSEPTSLAVFANRGSFGYPPLLCRRDAGRLELIPSLGPTGRFRLPLGARVEFKFRLAAFTIRSPQSFAAARFVDWMEPIALQWSEEDSVRRGS